VVRQGAALIKTKVIKKTLDPVWNEDHEMGIYEKDMPTGEVTIEVFDKDTLADDSIGKVKIPLSQLPFNQPQEFNLSLAGGQKKTNNGRVKIYLHMVNVGGAPGGAPMGHDPSRAVGGYPPQQGGYPPQQGGYPPQQGGYPPQQGGYPPQQGGYPPQQGGYPPQGGAPGYPPQ